MSKKPKISITTAPSVNVATSDGNETVVVNLTYQVEEALKKAKRSEYLAIYGLIIVLVTLAGVVIASITFVVTQLHQMNQQTLILQELKDKVDYIEQKTI